MTLHVRPAGRLDCRAMAELLNQIITRGGTTALTTPVTGDELSGWMTGSDAAAWHVAETEAGELLGFQWIAPNPNLPPEACDIATFVQVGQTGLGIGSRLFEATRKAAKAHGYAWINATIRADNTGGLTYYQSRGFEDYTRLPRVTLDDGTVVAKICKRYEL